MALKRILAVDDEPFNLEIIEEILEELRSPIEITNIPTSQALLLHVDSNFNDFSDKLH